ncbi:hypothetical protein [Nocardioides massiliensis]|uniref:Phosphodiesterase n=1 Tax=Nocardioides massiliensis TaxID=1325935 RepID=A0ABT9NR82_9ACTN|nr:hypothetical protein [Nocardioides massiliensis]MDP9822941.1 hypothetical protein [Nocardioides massiliensis]
MSTPRPVNQLARAGGAILAAATAAVDAVRTAEKPLHPRGEVWEATLERTGHPGPPTGVDWIDEPGTDPALARVSTAIGLPTGWPDFQGLALRVDVEHGWSDLLLASTGSGALTRFLLRPARSPHSPALTTLMPYRGPHGPLVLGARSTGPDTYAVAWASARGPWRTFAALRLLRPAPQEISFDPLRFPPPGLDNYRWTARLREPAYRSAQDGRRAPDAGAPD